MADYHPLIAKAVAGLEKNTSEARRHLYERARNALVTQLRSVTPALAESEITRERLALEEAIRKVEAEAARRARGGPLPGRPDRPSPPSAARRPGDAPGPAKDGPAAGETVAEAGGPAGGEAPPREPAGRERRAQPPGPGLPPESGVKGLRDVIADAEGLGEATAQGSRAAREAFAATAPARDARIEPHMEPEGLRPPPRRPPQPSPLAREPQGPPPRDVPPSRRGEPPVVREPAKAEPSALKSPGLRDRAPPPGRSLGPPSPSGPSADRGGSGLEPGPPARPEAVDFDGSPRARARPPFDERADDKQAGRRDRPFPLGPAEDDAREEEHGEGGAGERLGSLKALLSNPRALAAAALVIVLSLLSGAVYWQWPTIAGLFDRTEVATAPNGREPAPASRSKITDRVGAPGQLDARPQEGPTVAQRVVLYEEEPSNTAGKRFVGTAIWRTDSVVSGPGQPADMAVRAEIEIPEPKVTVKFSLRRNTDKSLPASHTIEIAFTLPPDFAGGGIANIPGILMKQAEQTRGVPLAGLSVKVTNNFFLIGLSSTDTDVQRNIQLLKERSWFDVPLVYANGRRAILAIEKGAPGDRAFNDAFAAWKE